MMAKVFEGHNYTCLACNYLQLDELALAYYAQNFTYYAFEQYSKRLPIMLNNMPTTTAIIPQLIYIILFLMTTSA